MKQEAEKERQMNQRRMQGENFSMKQKKEKSQDGEYNRGTEFIQQKHTVLHCWCRGSCVFIGCKVYTVDILYNHY